MSRETTDNASAGGFPWLSPGDFQDLHTGGVLYMNSAGKSPLPAVVEEAGKLAVSAQGKPWDSFGHGLTAEVRALYAALINADCENSIALAPSTAFSISLAAKNIMLSGKLGPGKKIIILENEMASNVYPWQNACSETGAELCIIPFPKPGKSWIQSMLTRLDSDVAVVSVGATHWCDGSILDLQLLSSALHSSYDCQSRPFFIIDGTQSVGAMHIDVKALKPDMLSCSVHKWLLCGRGLSLVYLNPQHHGSWLPLDHHDRTREGAQHSFWDDVGTMRGATPHVSDGWVSYPEPFLAGARRIDAGGGHNFVQMAMLKESLSLLTTRWSPERIYPYLTFLTDRLADLIAAAFPTGLLSVLQKEQRSGNILGVRVDTSQSWSVTATRIVQEMKCKHSIYCVVRLGVIRFSPYIFNTEAEMVRVAACLVDVVKNMAPRPRVLITGGWAAQHLYKAMSPEMEGHAMSVQCDLHITYRERSVRPWWAPGDRCHAMELSGRAARASAEAVLSSVRPDFIIHAATVSDNTTCDENTFDNNALIDAINAHVPHAITIFTSAEPLGFDRKLASLIKNHVVLQLGNLLGPVAPFHSQGESLIEFLDKAAYNRKDLDIINDDVRSFLDMRDLIRVVLHIVVSPLPCPMPEEGFFNVGGPGSVSSAGLATKICQLRGLPVEVLDVQNAVIFSTVDAHDSATKPWRFHSVSSSEYLERNVGRKETVFSSPTSHVSDSKATEAAFGVSFRSTEDMLKTMLMIL